MNITKIVINCCLVAICVTSTLMPSSANAQANEAEKSCETIAARIAKNKTISDALKTELLQVIADNCIEAFQQEKTPQN